MNDGSALRSIKLQKRHKGILFMCIVAFAICAVYAGAFVLKIFPPTEGWYSYYAYLINEEGAVPYVDFELLFPPLYVYVMALFTKIFGYGIVAVRILGVLIFATTGVFACLIYEKLTKSSLFGLVGGICTVAILQCEIVQIFYDYIRFMDLCIYISVYFLLRYLDKAMLEDNVKPRFDVNILASAIFAVLASMFKQSSGLAFLLFCILALLFFAICLPAKKELFLQTGVFVGVSAVMYGIMFAFLGIKGNFSEYIKYNFVSSVDAKGGGSIGNILWGWIVRSISEMSTGKAILCIVGALLAMAAIVALMILSIKFSAKYPEEREGFDSKFAKWAHIACALVLFAFVTFAFIWRGWAVFLSNSLPTIAIPILVFCTVFFAVLSVMLIFRKKLTIRDLKAHYKYVFFSGTVFVLGFAVGTSGGIAESQVALGYAFFPIMIACMARYHKKEVTAGVVCAAILFLSSAGFGRKIDTTYMWWGLGTGKYAEQTQTCDVPLLKGIKMTPAYAKMYNNVYEAVTENTEEGDEIFVFPHMPVIYLATDRPRATNTAIQWFDVSTDAAVIDDIEVIKEKKPKVLVLLSVDEGIIKAHEKSFRSGTKSGLNVMQDFLYDFVEDENYVCVSEDEISLNYVVTVWVLED